MDIYFDLAVNCVVCLKVKQTKLQFKNSETVSTKKLQLIRADICGPVVLISPSLINKWIS